MAQIERGMTSEKKTREIAFMDESTQEALFWSEIWACFEPVTAYGKRAKARLRPFRAGEEAACRNRIAQLQEDKRSFDRDRTVNERRRLSSFVDIDEILLSMLREEYVISPKDAMKLKQFALAGLAWAVAREDGEAGSQRAAASDSGDAGTSRAAASDSGDAGAPWVAASDSGDAGAPWVAVSDVGDAREPCNGWSAWPTVGLWQGLLSPFGDSVSSAFSISHLADESYRELTGQISRQMQRVATLTREQDAIWLERIGQRPTKERLLIIALPQGRATVEQLKKENAVKWLRDTPFESVFEVLQNPDLQDAKLQLETLRQHLDDAGLALLRELTCTIRQHLANWRMAIAAVAEYDLRLARLQLLHEWDGCVPEVSDDIVIEGAIHPLVVKRLTRTNEQYVPLSLSGISAVNVLSGSNMGGKTVAMSLLCICQALFQYGLPVPAKRFKTRLFSTLRFVAAATTEMHHGLSSFGHEVYQLGKAWEDSMRGAPGLMCFDEPGRSTNPWEGEALAIGLIRAARLHKHFGHVVWVASHFPGVLRETGIARFRVRGLQGGAWTFPAGESGLQGGACTVPTGERGVPGGASMLPSEAATTPSRMDERTIQSRILHLQAHMDYRVERMDTETATFEALRVAEWLGLPDPLLRASRQFLQEEEKADGI